MDPKTKACSKCKVLKPNTTDFFYPTGRVRKDSVKTIRAMCIECEKERKRTRKRNEHPGRIKARDRAFTSLRKTFPEMWRIFYYRELKNMEIEANLNLKAQNKPTQEDLDYLKEMIKETQRLLQNEKAREARAEKNSNKK